MPDKDLADLLLLVDEITVKFGLSAYKAVEILEWTQEWRDLGDPLPTTEDFARTVKYYLEDEKEALAKGITVEQAMLRQTWTLKKPKPNKDNEPPKLVPFPGGRTDPEDKK
jgi:hypothetical protein